MPAAGYAYISSHFPTSRYTQDLRKIINKRTAYSYGEASYAQRLVREGRIRAASPRVGHEGIRVSESYCVSPNTKQKLIKKYKFN